MSAYKNIKGAWRTRKQALQHIKKELVAGRLGATGPDGMCVYERTCGGVVTHCSVGCLFDQNQIKWIKSRNLNSGTRVQYLAERVGLKNIETVTGLNLSELAQLQENHDNDVFWRMGKIDLNRSDLYKYLSKELAKI